MFFFKKKVKVPKEKDNSNFKVVERIDLKPYDSLKFDLIYAHDEIVLENEDVVIGCRKYKKANLKFMLVNDFKSFSKYSLDNNTLNKYIDQKGYLEYISKEDISCESEVQIIIFKEKTEEIKRYCFLNTSATKKCYRQFFIYDHDHGQLLSYRKLRDFGALREEYLTSLYFDLACIDKEMY